MDHLDSFPVLASELMKETNRNPVLSRVLLLVLHGWPDVCDNDELKSQAVLVKKVRTSSSAGLGK